MKKILALMICMSVLACAACFCLNAATVYTANDVLWVLRDIIRNENSAEFDINSDGEVNLVDALGLLRLAFKGGYTLGTPTSTTIATSGESWWDRGVQYPRLLVKSDGTLLATFEELNAGLSSSKPGYPIYKSTDDGATWERITVVRDNDSVIQSEWNPQLFELTQPLGKYKAGTILLAGCSIDGAHSKKSAIRLYASTNGGNTFGTPITIAEAGGTDEGVWEPFLVQLDDGRLVCFYSDDSDSAHSQKIVYKISSDGVNFGNAVEVVASNKKDERPGMPVVTRLGDGTYFMVYEVVNHASVSGNPVYYRTSSDGLNWGTVSSLGTALSSGGKALGSGPYCVWTPVGGKSGTLIVSGTFMRKGSSSTGTDYFLSTDGGKTWTTTSHLIPYDASIDHCGYSNSMAVSLDGKTLYAINNPEDKTNGDNSKIVFAKARWQ